MNFRLIFTILIVGLSGLIAQVLLLRELLVSFYGNELTLGIILANWIIAEALGVFVIGKFIDRLKSRTSVFIGLQLLFSLFLPLSIYLCRTIKEISGVSFGESIGLFSIFTYSFLIIFPVSFCHGGLFNSLCKIYASRIGKSASSIGRVYSWETIGTIFGGIAFTYFLIPHFNSFQIIFIISLVNIIICLLFFKRASKALRYLNLALIFLLIFFMFNGGINLIDKLSINRQWKTKHVLEYRNSIYGNIVLTRDEEQYTFYYNGLPIITTPYPDTIFVKEFANLPLLFHSQPKDILIIGAGAGGLINEILKQAVRRVDYLELDPLVIEMLKEYPTALTEKELKDPRVNIINLDARVFLKNTLDKYDIVLIGFSNQSDLSTNRFFTQEFFALVRIKLNKEGVFAFWLPSSLTYLGQELRDLNSSILNGLKKIYNYLRIIPGDYNIFLASTSQNIKDVDANLLSQRLNERNIKPGILVPSYLKYRLGNYWLDYFNRSLEGSTVKINQDAMPIAVFEALSFSNKRFASKFNPLLDFSQNLNLVWIAAFILFLTLLLFYIFNQNKNKKLCVAYSIATTGFFAMLSNLVLNFSFQVFYGYLYHALGILISMFMAGIALGSMFMTEVVEKIKHKLRIFIGIEILIIAFTYLMAILITKYLAQLRYEYLFFYALFATCGLLIGLEFPLASKIYLSVNGSVGKTVGIVYAADLIGGWVAGILGGIILLPVLGIFNTCLVIILFKLSSLILLTLS